MKTNIKRPPAHTHEGATAKAINPEMQLRRSVMACMLWEKEFYEDGQSIAERIVSEVALVKPKTVAEIAIEARTKMKLRHVPLLIVRAMAACSSHRYLVANTLSEVIQRPDELTEFVSLYWKDKKQPLAAQVKKGLAKAFQKFDAFSLAKYNRDGQIKLRDVLFLCHAKPRDPAQAAVWEQLVKGTLPTPDTWEVALSGGADKKQTWERLLAEGKLGALALLRNLRNMKDVGVDKQAIRKALANIKVERVLPFRFISAARVVPQLEPELEIAMFKCLEGKEKLPGSTVLLVDVSGSMDGKISSKSEVTRSDAACGLAMLLREICDEISIATFSNSFVEVPPRRGFALRDSILQSQEHGGTALGVAVKTAQLVYKAINRIIVISDEQCQDTVPDPDPKGRAYMINVASYQNGVGYGAWTHIDGWSEAVADYLIELEKTKTI